MIKELMMNRPGIGGSVCVGWQGDGCDGDPFGLLPAHVCTECGRELKLSPDQLYTCEYGHTQASGHRSWGSQSLPLFTTECVGPRWFRVAMFDGPNGEYYALHDHVAAQFPIGGTTLRTHKGRSVLLTELVIDIRIGVKEITVDGYDPDEVSVLLLPIGLNMHRVVIVDERPTDRRSTMDGYVTIELDAGIKIAPEEYSAAFRERSPRVLDLQTLEQCMRGDDA
jgi:hypothetical protein